MIHAALDVGRLAATFNDRGVFLVNDDGFRPAEVGQFDALELDAEIFADDLAAREDRDVFEHCLAAIAKAGSLAAVAEARGFHSGDVERAAELVHDEGRERFAFDFFGDDEQRLA